MQCQVKLGPSDWKKLARDEDYARYNRFLRQHFVDGNPKARWCPGVGCGAVMMRKKEHNEVDGTEFIEWLLSS